MIGRKTKGGLVMMSNPLMPPLPPGLVRGPDACGLSIGEGVGDACGEVDGSGVGATCKVNLAHGFG